MQKESLTILETLPPLSVDPHFMALEAMAESMQKKLLARLFAEEPDRFSKFHFQLEGLLIDFSKQRIDQSVFEKLADLKK